MTGSRRERCVRKYSSRCVSVEKCAQFPQIKKELSFLLHLGQGEKCKIQQPPAIELKAEGLLPQIRASRRAAFLPQHITSRTTW